MKMIKLCLVGLMVILAFTPIAMTNPDMGAYDPRADTDRDGDVDYDDLIVLAGAYGSNLVLPSEPGMTVVYVYQLETNPPEVENARVAIIDPENDYQAVQIGYTNSSGMMNVTLNENSDYTAVAWSSATYNYANFTTNEFAEASVAIQLGFPRLPSNWVTITFVNKTTGALVTNERTVVADIHELIFTGGDWEDIRQKGFVNCQAGDFRGVLVLGPSTTADEETTQPNTMYGVSVFDAFLNLYGSAVYTPDENGNANVISYI